MLKQFRSPILKRYSLLLVMVFTIMGLSYLLISLSLSNHYLQQVQTRLHLNVADTLIEDNQLVKQSRLNQDAITETFHRYMLLNPHLEIYLVDLKGKVLQYSADAKKIKRHQIHIQPLMQFLKRNKMPGADFPLGDDPRSLTGQKPFSVAYLPNKAHPEAYLYVIIQDSIEQEANRQLQESILLKLSAWSFLSSLVIGLVLGAILFYHLTKRISRLSQALTDFKNHPEQAIEAPTQIKDDLDQLELVFTEMTQKIQQQIKQLADTDQQRRFMISSLSHDLRTPLTNLLGYMEHTSQNHPNDYLTIAYQNGLKLKHYLDQLFDFAKLDMDSFKLHKQELSLSEFCFDIFQQYQTAFPTRQWHIKIPHNLLYEFDANQLERAIRNLLDNALKHGEGPITLWLEKTENSIKIKVCDQGSLLKQGYETDNFTPLYQTESNKSSQHKTQGSGLGLVIIQSIVEKHNGQLSCFREQEQNCFQIELPTG